MSTQPETPTLKPCPCCGSDEVAPNTITYSATHVAEQGWAQAKFHGVNCIRCGLSNRGIIGFMTPEDAAAAWNRRAPDPVRDRWVSERDVTAVHHAMCSCGGRGPDDGPCEACEFYHRLAALALGETTP